VNECTWEPIKSLSNAMEKVHKFHQLFLNKLKYVPHGTVIQRGGDVTDVNVKEFIYLNVHP